MAQIIPDPTTFTSSFQSTGSFIENLDTQFRASILDKQKGLQNIYGKDVWGSDIQSLTEKAPSKKKRTVAEIMAEFGQ